ncbi:MAG: hypothetical protein RL145_1971 [Pseudomonadota bacterium]
MRLRRRGLGNALEFVSEGLQDVGRSGGFGVRQFDQDQQPAGALYQGADGAGIAFALDEVTLPVSRKLAILDLGRAQVDIEVIGDMAMPILALAAGGRVCFGPVADWQSVPGAVRPPVGCRCSGRWFQ